MGTNKFQSNKITGPTSSAAKVFFTFWNSKRLHGRYELNPSLYMFPDGLKSLDILMDGRSINDLKSMYSTSYKDDDSLSSFHYLNLLRLLGKYYAAWTPAITKDMFMSKYYVAAFDTRCTSLETGANNGSVLPLLRSGELKLSLRFSAPTTETYEVLGLLLTPSLMTVGPKGEVSISYRS